MRFIKIDPYVWINPEHVVSVGPSLLGDTAVVLLTGGHVVECRESNVDDVLSALLDVAP